MLEIKEDELGVEDNFYPSVNMDSATVGIKRDGHGDNNHEVEVNFYPSGDMVSAIVGIDNDTSDYTEKDIQESVEFVNFLHFLHDNDDTVKTDKKYNVNGDNTKDSDSGVKESKDTSARDKTQEYF